jgi:IS30 family transposase
MATQKSFTTATDMPDYFCDPASPWQRGSNENTIALLRQYFPKSTDLSAYGIEDLKHVAQSSMADHANPSTGRAEPNESLIY